MIFIHCPPCSTSSKPMQTSCNCLVRRILIMSSGICQCKHPSSPRGHPSLIFANTSGIPQNTTYVHHVLVGAALRVAYGEEKIVSAWWRRIDLLQKQIANISPVRTTARHQLAGIRGESPTPSSRRMRSSTTNASLAAYAVFERNQCSRGTNRDVPP